MTYETFVKEMLEQFPFLREQCLVYKEEYDTLPYVAIGAVLIPWLMASLEARDVGNIVKVCDFLEVAAEEGRTDPHLDEFDNN